MQKQLAFVIAAAILLTAFASVALYTVHVANAQSLTSNLTGAGGAKNMTGNMTGAAANMTKNATSAAGANMTK